MKRVSLLFVAFFLSSASAGLAAPQEATISDAPIAAVAQGRGSYLGVGLDEVTPEAVGRLKLKAERGAVIIDVAADSPAAKAGLQKNDVIVRWDGEQIESAIQLSRIRRETPPGRTVRLGIIRDGREMEVSVQLSERPQRVATTIGRGYAPRIAGTRFRPGRVVRGAATRLGLQMMSLTPQMAEYFGLAQRSGALVTWVDQDSSVAKAGLKAGDVILSIGGESVDNPSEAWRTLKQKAGETVEIKVMRDRREQSFTVQLDKSTASTWVIGPGELVDTVLPAMPIEAPMPSIVLPELPAIAPMPQIHITPMPLMKWKFRIEI
ncbi:MAG TPA: PDZ domain-containing protein [Blastocatellia bacterium]|nr:PDZ domain-containing protein [Blastocatellia bacterium]